VREASDEALRRLAAEEAVQLLERGLDVLELDPSHPPHSRCEILIALAASLDAVGRRRDARGRYVEAARVARLQGSPLHFAAAALGWTRHVPGYVVAGRREVEAISMLDEALDGLGDRDPSLRLELLAALLPKLYWAGEEGIARADRLSREAIEEARRQELPRLQALCLCRRHLLLWHPEGLEERLALAREAVGLADSETDPALTLEARFLRVVDRLEIGEVERALEDVDFYAQLAEETHQPNLVLQALSWRNAWAQAAGRVSETEQGIARGFELAQTARVPTARHALLVQQTLLDWTRDELSQLDPALEAVADAHESLDSWHALVAWLATEIGDTPLATAHLQALDKPDVLPLARSFDGVFVAAAKAIAAFRLGDVESAQRVYRELLPYAGRHVVGVFGTVLLGSASRYLGLLAATIGRYDEAERHFEEARAANWRTGAVLWAAHTLCDHAETLLSRGGPSDRPAAKRLLDEASDLADTSDLVGVTTRGQLLQRELDGITTLPRRPRVG
jgi:tetratricopeptide (TPR) repeat protein